MEAKIWKSACVTWSSKWCQSWASTPWAKWDAILRCRRIKTFSRACMASETNPYAADEQRPMEQSGGRKEDHVLVLQSSWCTEIQASLFSKPRRLPALTGIASPLSCYGRNQCSRVTIFILQRSKYRKDREAFVFKDHILQQGDDQ